MKILAQTSISSLTPSKSDRLSGQDEKQRTVSEVAHEVLFSSSLEQKLRIVAEKLVSFEDPTSGSLSTEAALRPGRPDSLRFGRFQREKRETPPLPAAPHLVDEENRGILLHFFANHELLAAELMALALLKFPEAPVSFRRGLYRTMQEEQRHTLHYIRRMKECGVSFGDYPVNGFFWNAVSTMKSPLDYVSRLSLTFEQANLDYSSHFAKVLEEAGDPLSASMMRRIHRDEISHVSYGLKWFRKWKNQGLSDWHCLESLLEFPLSPSRAKGNGTQFNREARIAAGFAENYVDHLSVFERSKGRSPDVFLFNPEAEESLASLPARYQPDKKALSLIRDLEILGAFLARRDDVMLMRCKPTLSHLAKLREAGFTLPEFESLSPDGQLPEQSLLRKRRIHSIRPWSVAPDLPGRLGNLLENCSVKTAPRPWSEDYGALFSKVEQSRIFQPWMNQSLICVTSGELNRNLQRLKDQGHRRAVIKAPVSAAGRGIYFVSTEQALFGRELSRALRIMKRQGNLLLEPFHDRVFDFSVQYVIEADHSIRSLGMLRQLISPGGQYVGSIAPLKFCQGLDPELAQFLMKTVLPQYDTDEALAIALRSLAKEFDYVGPLGVDAYIYGDESARLQHRLICEINPRYTMGRLTLELRRQIAPGRNLRFQILGGDTKMLSAPSRFMLDENGKLDSGEFILNEIFSDTHFLAKLSVSRELQSFYSLRDGEKY